MNPPLPPDLINPAFEELDEVAATADNFAQNDTFLFKCWQSFHVQSNYARDSTVPRYRNLFWRVWSNPNLRYVSNEEFNLLWQQCRRPIDTTPYRPGPLFPPDQREQMRREASQPPLSPLPINLDPLPTPESPESPRRITFDEQNLAQSSRTGRERTSSGASAAASRPPFRRTGSGRSLNPGATRGARGRPGVLRRRSAQNRQPGSRPTSAEYVTSQVTPDDGSDRRPERSQANFKLGSSWQSEDEAEETPEVAQQPLPAEPASSGSLVDVDFRAKFREAREMSVGTSFTPTSFLRKNRSSVRFADEVHGSTETLRSLNQTSAEQARCRDRTNSQALADSDDSDVGRETPGLERVHSQLSMAIKNKRHESGSNNIGPDQEESAKIVENRKKEEELLQRGRDAAKANIPRSRQTRPDGNYRSPSPGATF